MNLGTWLIRKIFYTKKRKPTPPPRKVYTPPRKVYVPPPPIVRYGHCPKCDTKRKSHEIKKNYREVERDGWYWWIWYYLLACQTCGAIFNKELNEVQKESIEGRIMRLEAKRLRDIRRRKEDAKLRKQRREQQERDDEERRARRRRESSYSPSSSRSSSRSSSGFGGGFSGGGGAGRSGRPR